MGCTLFLAASGVGFMSQAEHGGHSPSLEGIESNRTDVHRPFAIIHVKPHICNPGSHHPDMSCRACGTGSYAEDADSPSDKTDKP